MLAATLHESERHVDVKDIPEPRATQLRIVQDSNPGVERTALPIYYVDDERDLSYVEPIKIPEYHALDRKLLKPLLEALEKGDIELAAALAPAGKRLMGYTVVTEPFDYTHWGSYAADIDTVRIEKGLYPMFAEKFSRHEAKDCYTNQVADFQGCHQWMDGIITSSNLSPRSVGERTVVWPQNYAHAVAHDILEQDMRNPADRSPNRVYLVYPFAAKEHHFESHIDGKSLVTWKIEDTSLPEFLPKGVYPMQDLRNGGADLGVTKFVTPQMLFCIKANKIYPQEVQLTGNQFITFGETDLTVVKRTQFNVKEKLLIDYPNMKADEINEALSRMEWMNRPSLPLDFKIGMAKAKAGQQPQLSEPNPQRETGR